MGKKQEHQATTKSRPGPAPKVKANSPHHEQQGNKQHNKGNKRKRSLGDKGEGQGAGALLKMPKIDVEQPKSGGR